MKNIFKYPLVLIILSTFLIACKVDDPVLIEEEEVLFLEGEFILLDSTGSTCDLFFQTETRAYHLGNPFNEYFENKAYFFRDTQQIVMTYESIKDESECNEDFIENTIGNLALYEQLPIITSKEQYQEATTSGISIDSAQVVGNYLILDYRSSGCYLYEWEPFLVESEDVLESFPPQRNLKLVTHPIGGCAAVKTKRGIFNLQDLQVEGGSVILNIAHGFQGEFETLNYIY